MRQRDSDDIIRVHYSESCDEEERLISRSGQVESFITLEFIKQAIENIKVDLDRKQLDIIEIGCATGFYSLQLAKSGHHVVATDLLEKHIAIVREKAQVDSIGSDMLETHIDNATDLSRYADESFDLVLCLGPLYHLFSSEEIESAIAEAIRICRSGGFVFFAYLTQDSIVLSYFLRHNKLSECYGKSLEADFHPVVDPIEIFRGFYIDEFEGLMDNFEDIEHLHSVATDGMSHQMREHVDNLDEEGFEIWKQYCLHTCERKDLQGYSNHMLWIGRKHR
jgi:2-polyprenyl-3-methyl-5-hydroxy-6-metoxy-1,4-benzoquinol methylase